ncbi:SRPBCC family protein [Micrococcus sp.]|uniref:SRPBCC family protein n=1 Tax=Micrococcus sp. TaxID=1271 RepID=UPI002A91A502|nr:SRPBCC family protein [Micrococcus sp.]MDY6054642.1 SRPBCC family protein [Micrococcus sp.]
MTEMNKTPQGETKISVTRTIDASAKDIFDFLTLPANHAQIDGSGFIRSDDRTQRIQKVGDVFTMNMQGDHMGGEYQTDNHVVAYDPNKRVGWKTAPAGTQPPGWQWVYVLEDNGSDSTDVTLIYDWTDVTDPDLLAKNLFPLLTEEQLEESLNKLAAAVA